MTTSHEILAAIRSAYSQSAVVREVCLDDPYEYAIYRRYCLDGPNARFYTGKFDGLEVADAVPEGWHPHDTKFTRRIDALMRDAQGYTAIEIKVSRSDFKRDTEEKRRAWKEHTRRFIYATPKGLLAPEEVPPGCGLWEFEVGYGIRTVKRAKVNKVPRPLPQAVLDSMLYRVSNYEKAERAASLGEAA